MTFQNLSFQYIIFTKKYVNIKLFEIRLYKFKI